MRILGILVTQSLDFDLHVTEVVWSKSLICNRIVRCYIVKKTDFHITLYKSLVRLFLFFICLENIKKHIEALSSAQTKFPRVGTRCSIPKEGIDSPNFQYARFC